MNRTEKTFLMILKDALHFENTRSEIANIDWEIVLCEAEKQDLFPFIYDAATTYPSFAAFDEEHPQYFETAVSAIVAQMQQTDAFLELYQSFLAVGLAPVTMKGIICRELYGKRADFRPSGDEDILIEKKEYEKAVEVLTNCGYRMYEQPDRKMDVTQEVTFYGNHLFVELHLNPFGTDSTTRKKMNGWFRDVFQSKETIMVKGVPIRTMMPTDHFLFLVFHAFKHFTADGFGVRMMLDVLLFVEKYGERLDWNYVDRGLKSISACGFLADLMEIGKRYLGFSLTYGSPICPEELLDDMFRGGIFGNSTSADRTAGRFVSDIVRKGKNSDNKVSSYIRLLFPSWRTWTAWKPYLKDRPWMIVREWFCRTERYLRGETSSRNMKELDASYKIAEERMVLLGKYGIL